MISIIVYVIFITGSGFSDQKFARYSDNGTNELQQRFQRDLNFEVESYTATSVSLKSGVEVVDVVYSSSTIGDPSFSSLLEDGRSLMTQAVDGRVQIYFLSPSTFYSICARSSSLDPPFEKCITVQTDQFRGTVKNIVATEEDGQGIMITWDPPEGFQETDDLKYLVFCPREADSDDGPSDEDVFESSGDDTNGTNFPSEGSGGNPSNGPSAPSYPAQTCDLSFSTMRLRALIPNSVLKNQSSLNICIKAMWKSQETKSKTCIDVKGYFLNDVKWTDLKNGSVVIKWRQNFPNERVSLDLEPLNACDCLTDNWKEEWSRRKEVGNGDVMLSSVPNGQLRLLLFSAKDQNLSPSLVANILLNGSNIHINETIRITGRKKSLNFVWCRPFASYIPVQIEFHSNATSSNARQVSKRFVGCKWNFELRNLDPFSAYSWSISLSTVVRSFPVMTGVEITQPTVCDKIPEFEEKLEMDDRNKFYDATFSIKRPDNPGGIIQELSIKIHDAETDIEIEEIHPICSKTKVCRIKSSYEFVPDRKYAVSISCANKEPAKFGPSIQRIFKTEAVVPGLAFGALRLSRIHWSNGASFASVRIVVDQELIDHSAGKIVSLMVLYGAVGHLPPVLNGTLHKRSNKSRLENLTSNSSLKFYELNLDPKAKEFLLSDLQFGTEYQVMLRFSNNKAFSSTNKISFRTYENLGNTFAYFIVMISVYIFAQFQVGFLSRKPKDSKGMNISSYLSHPDEREFRRPISKTNTKLDLEPLLGDPQNEMKQLFKSLNGVRFPFSVAESQREENCDKNRYTDIVPYDYNRVILKERPGQPSENYMNASYVHSYERVSAFIAAQGPMENTLVDFWRMIWQNNVRVICMTTKCKEAIEKCIKYWPSVGEGTVTAGEMTIKSLMETKDDSNDYIVRQFQLQKNWTNRLVHQFHFTTWPDKRCPSSLDSLLRMILAAKKIASVSKSEPPVVVHCSAGIGRTGTLIALWNIIDALNDPMTEEVDIVSIVFKLRMMRMNMVQSLNQFIFLHKSLSRLVELKLGSMMINNEETGTWDEKFCSPEMGHQRTSGSHLYVSEDEDLESITDDDQDSISSDVHKKGITNTINYDENVEDKNEMQTEGQSPDSKKSM